MLLWTPAALIPALYLAAFAGLGALALRRAGERLPGWIALAAFAAVAVLFGSVLAGGRALVAVETLSGVTPFGELGTGHVRADSTTAAQVLAVLPAQAAGRRALAAGEWPLWDPYAGAGSPLAGGAARPFALLPALALALPVADAAGATAALRVLVAIVFTFLWLARAGAAPAAAAAGAFSYGLGGFLQRWAPAPAAEAAALLPVLLWAVARADERRGRGDLALLAAAVAALCAAGGEAATYALLTGFAYLVARLARRPAAERSRAIAAPLVAAALGAAVAAPAWWPAMGLEAVSEQALLLRDRAQDLRRSDPLGLATLADPSRRREALAATSGRVVQALAPLAFGDRRRGAAWGPADVEQPAAAYPGAAALALALAGAAGWAAARRRGTPENAGPGLADEPFLLGAAAVSGLFVARPPGLVSLADHLPLLGPSADFHEQVAMVFALAVAGLAATGLGRLAAMPRKRRRRLAGATAAVLLGVLLWATLDHPAPEGTPEPLARARRIALAVQCAAVVGVAAGPAAAAPFAVAAELVALHRGVHSGRPRDEIYPETPAVTLVQEAAAGRPGARMAALEGAFPPQLGSIYALADARLEGPHRSQAWAQMVAPIERVRGGRQVARLQTADHPLFDLLGVRWLVARAGDRPAGSWRRLAVTGESAVWEREGALPPLFLPPAAEVFPGGDWAGRLAQVADFHVLALIRPSPGRPGDWRAAGAADDAVTVERFGLTAIRARARLGAERLLATSIYQDRGWRALADGHPLAPLAANGPLLAAWLPPGTERIDLVYRPRPFFTGLLAAGLALAAGAAWLARPRAARPEPG